MATLIGLLLALLHPVYQTARQQTASLKCVRHLKQWSTAITAYLQDHDGRFPDPAPWKDGRRWNHSQANFAANIGYKHNGAANVLFVDGHMEPLTRFHKEQVLPK
ncbi:MAG TPA: H-X9-DG-CTERM domain-containing protein [Chthoniobacteraceae bacterium]|nr:H-X9-DG-CTERM domain-containing protein [Chthoniobacteraceae bacterium]